MPQDYVTIGVDEVRQESRSGLAVLLVIDGESKWVPRSTIHEPELLECGQTDVVVEIAKWFAEKEGLVSEDDD